VHARALIASLAVAGALVAAGCGDEDDSATTATDAEATTAPVGEETAVTGQNLPPDQDITTTPEQTTVPEEGAGEIGPERSATDDEAAIKETLGTVLLMSGDPAQICEELVTRRYVQRSYGSAAGCRAGQDEQSAPEVVTFEGFEIGASRARGVVRFQGGVYDGEKGDVELVLEDGRWKLDSLRVDVPPGP
jgi:hypothetical protein